MIFNYKKRAFTLIELLVVIAIIGILVALATFSYTRVRKQARDVKRKEDIAAIAGALQLYYQDNYKYVNMSGSVTVFTSTATTLGELSTGKYIDLPSAAMDSYPYEYCTVEGYNYALRAKLEITKESVLEESGGLCSIPGYYISGEYIDDNGLGDSYTSKSTGFE
ncbi:MAG: type II secretion system protein [Patescibacteria group bacterium]|jgi:prepilin-type N-terminal cleavage/methylation domain-containing protein